MTSASASSAVSEIPTRIIIPLRLIRRRARPRHRALAVGPSFARRSFVRSSVRSRDATTTTRRSRAMTTSR
eukprot:29743-Pelagococcus_subviridis.AAC.3